MKKQLSLLVYLIGTSCVLGQIQYETVRDNPDFIPFLNINLQYFDTDVSLRTIDAINFNASIWGNFEPVNGLGVDFRIRRSYLTMGQLAYDDHMHFQNYEVGAYYKIGGGTVRKPTKVVLDADQYDDYYENVRVYTSTSIVIPALRRRDFLVRGGFYNLASPIDIEELEDDFGQSPFTESLGRARNTGLYGGIALRSITNVFVNTEQFGYQFNSHATLIYFDALITGTRIYDPWAPDMDLSEQAKDAIGSLPIGFRFGMSGFQIEQKKYTNKKFGMSYNFEAGYRNYMGWYISGGLGLTILKWNKND